MKPLLLKRQNSKTNLRLWSARVLLALFTVTFVIPSLAYAETPIQGLIGSPLESDQQPAAMPDRPVIAPGPATAPDDSATPTSADPSDSTDITLSKLPKSIAFGAFFPTITDPATDDTVITDAEAKWGRPIDVVMYFQAWDDPDPQWSIPRLDILKKVEPRTPLITWEPWQPNGGPYRKDYQLTDIAAGKFDTYINDWATQLATYGKPVYLRPMHEMNGDWYPWGGGIWPNNPTNYIAAWRHMHDIFTADKATNVKWVWAVNTQDVPSNNHFENYYPGDDYVDILGMDGYNWGTTQWWSQWRSFDQVFYDAYQRLAKVGPEPIWITETASANKPGNKQDWIDDMWTSAAFYPRLTDIIWFNANKETNWAE